MSNLQESLSFQLSHKCNNIGLALLRGYSLGWAAASALFTSLGGHRIDEGSRAGIDSSRPSQTVRARRFHADKLSRPDRDEAS